MRKWTSDFVDLAGHRMSYHRTGGDLPVLLLAHGADIAAVIHRLGLERPAVLGHSVGATSMALFANRFPEITSKIVLE
ncbi:MAG: pimeloyl-ACP methyl ester carboxylesterase [Gammaproteobacteria bacterium]|jgi:pimeloyl-ACP methyl ester carboxylesterase